MDGLSLVDVIDAKMTARPKPMAFWSFSTGGRGKKPYIDLELQKGTTPLVKLARGIPTRNFQNNHHLSIEEKDYAGERTILDNRHKLLISKKGDVRPAIRLGHRPCRNHESSRGANPPSPRIFRTTLGLADLRPQ